MSAQISGTVATREHVRNTVNGNAIQRVTLTQGQSYQTAPDSQAGLDAQNFSPGDNVVLLLTERTRRDRTLVITKIVALAEGLEP